MDIELLRFRKVLSDDRLTKLTGLCLVVEKMINTKLQSYLLSPLRIVQAGMKELWDSVNMYMQAVGKTREELDSLISSIQKNRLKIFPQQYDQILAAAAPKIAHIILKAKRDYRMDTDEEDIFQTIMLEVSQALPDFNPARAGLETYIKTIAENQLAKIGEQEGQKSKAPSMKAWWCPNPECKNKKVIETEKTRVSENSVTPEEKEWIEAEGINYADLLRCPYCGQIFDRTKVIETFLKMPGGEETATDVASPATEDEEEKDWISEVPSEEGGIPSGDIFPIEQEIERIQDDLRAMLAKDDETSSDAVKLADVFDMLLEGKTYEEIANAYSDNFQLAICDKGHITSTPLTPKQGYKKDAEGNKILDTNGQPILEVQYPTCPQVLADGSVCGASLRSYKDESPAQRGQSIVLKMRRFFDSNDDAKALRERLKELNTERP